VLRLAVRRGQRITPDVLQHPVTQSRVLFATETFPVPEHFNEDFAALTPELIEHLHRQGVILVGIDTPSVDRFDSKDLPTHQMVLHHDMAILEGLVLDAVPDGVYELIALPLLLVGFDASPVRAVLRSLD
jgi:arylformamidase